MYIVNCKLPSSHPFCPSLDRNQSKLVWSYACIHVSVTEIKVLCVCVCVTEIKGLYVCVCH